MEFIEKDVKKVLVSSEEIEARSKELAEMIEKDYDNKKPILLCLLNGALPFMATLVKKIRTDVEYQCVKVSSYAGTTSTGTVSFGSFDVEKLNGRDILIIEDIVDTGLTIKKVKEYLFSIGALSVEVVTLLDKPSRRVADIYPKYIGFTVPNEFVIGFGLDYNEKYRNLPYVGVLKEDAI